MKSKNDKINELLEKWKAKYDEKGLKGFKKDGIINEEQYNNSSPKILFITKEPNDPNKEEWDFRQWWKEEVKYSFSLRISEWSYGILNDFPPIEEITDEKRKGVIQQIAFMNIKKTGGGGNSNYNEIEEHVEDYREFIHDEIQIINPDIIITGLTWGSLRDKVFSDKTGKLMIEWKQSGYGVKVGVFQLENTSSVVIDFYHPSARIPPAASYSLLENVFKHPIIKEKLKK